MFGLSQTRNRRNAVPEDRAVSFVVIAYNEAENIAGALASIKALQGLGEHEVVVVDDGSHDDTTEIVAKLAAQDSHLRLVELGENRGRGYARRRGITESSGNFVATVDADISLPSDWLVSALAALGDHAAVGGTAVPDGDVSYLYRRFRLTPRVVGHTTAVTGSNALFRREVFDIVQFDSSLREGEDVALNHALVGAGLSVATVPGLVVRHKENKGLCESLRWLYESGNGATRQLLTYRRVRGPDLVAGAFIGSIGVGILAASQGRRLLGIAIPLGLITAASIQHVRSRFKTPWSQWQKVLGSVTVDSAMLTAYFAGRMVGLKAAWRRQGD
jgi:GT2 family glycosyltransferase